MAAVGLPDEGGTADLVFRNPLVDTRANGTDVGSPPLSPTVRSVRDRPPTPLHPMRSVVNRPPTPLHPGHCRSRSVADRPSTPVHTEANRPLALANNSAATNVDTPVHSVKEIPIDPVSNFPFEDEPITIPLSDNVMLGRSTEQCASHLSPHHGDGDEPCPVTTLTPATNAEPSPVAANDASQSLEQPKAVDTTPQADEPVPTVDDGDVMEVEPCVNTRPPLVDGPPVSSELPRPDNNDDASQPIRDDDSHPVNTSQRFVDLDEPNEDRSYPAAPICISDDEDAIDDDDDEMRDSSDVEFVSEQSALEITSENVKLALDQLHLRNIVVTVPLFAQFEQAKVDDLAVVHAIEEYFRVETARRRKPQSTIAYTSPGSVLIICGSLIRARKLNAFFERHGKLRVALHTFENHRDRSYRRASNNMKSLDEVIGNVNIIITHAKIVLSDAHRGCANFRNVLLLVLDSVEKTNSRGHPISMMMRDHYRSFGESMRPRVLAIARHQIHPMQAAPIEHNLFAKFCSGTATEVLTWKSCYGKGARKPEHDLLDVEFLTYQRDFSEMRFEHGRKPPQPARVRDRRGFTAIDSVVDEVGRMGVALYLKRSLQKRADHSCGDRSSNHKTCEIEVENIPIVGLSCKMMSLLNELYEAYRASTDIDALMAIIHAGQPAVACAITEVIRSLQLFRSLEVGTALGYQGEAHTTSNSGNGSEYRKWQGPDTDDDEISSFVAGDLNILVVSSEFTKVPDRRPFPPCPLVIRFDGSAADPNVDGRGGRCRVIVFQEHRKPHLLTETTVPKGPDLLPSSRRLADKGDDKKKPEPKKIRNDDDDDQTDLLESLPSKEPSKQLSMTPGNSPVQSTKSIMEVNQKHRQPECLTRPDSRKQKSSECYPAETFYRKPPRAILGPNVSGSERAYIYRILLFRDDQKERSFPLSGVTRVGLEEFAIVLSEKLDDDDVVFSLRDIENGAGNGTRMKGYLKLDYQGSVTFDSEKLKKAQEYTTLVFTLMDTSFSKEKFDWTPRPNKTKGNHEEDVASDSYLRRYFILPLVTLNDRVDADMSDNGLNYDTQITETMKTATGTNGSQEEMSKKYIEYFGDQRKPSATVDKHVKVDWTAVDFLLSIQEREHHKEEYQKCNALKPEEYHTLEGKLLFSSLPSETALLSGHLDYNRTPLSRIKRSRKFALNDDGTFLPHNDITYIIGFNATRDSIRKQEKATGIEKDVIDVDDTGSTPVKNTDDQNALLEKIPVRWCVDQQKLVEIPAGEVKKGITYQDFNCSRNVLKKRTTWIGQVCHEIEPYYNRFYSQRIQHLDQPLLYAVRPRKATVEELVKVLDGESVEDICGGIANDGNSGRFMVPELSRQYPLPVGCIFLPVSLFYIEQHVQTCELRNMFRAVSPGKPEIHMMIRSMTASFVNSTTNYERLEFLGDSVLKLTCTVRLVTNHTHNSEGMLSSIRSEEVSNFRLFLEAKRMELYNYLRFATLTEHEWTPPGTDVRAKAIRVQMKGLADVVEALCGTYFLYGMRSLASGDDSPKKRAKKDAPAVEKGNTSGGSENDDHDVNDDSIVECLYGGDAETDDQGISKGKDESSHAKTTNVEIGSTQSRKRKRNSNTICNDSKHDAVTGSTTTRTNADSETRMSATSAERGYYLACKFLEHCNVMKGEEPIHREILLSGIHSLHPKGSPRPQNITVGAFPHDRRLTNPLVPWDAHLGVLEGIIGYKFKRRHLLVTALTHGSFVKPNGACTPVTETYERFEFLGDAVADFFVVCYLYERFPEHGPGDLTTLKGNIVSNESFARISVTRGLHKYVYHNSASLAGEVDRFIQSMSSEPTMDRFLNQQQVKGGSGENGEAGTGDTADKEITQVVHSGYKRDLGEIAAPKILGDIFEAIVGAVFVDSGLAQAWRVCYRLLDTSLRVNSSREREDLHPCDELADMVMRVWKIPDWPRYEFQRWSAFGPKGKRCIIFILGEKIVFGVGSNERRAKLKAATNALDMLRDKNPESHGAKLLKYLMEEATRRRVAQLKSAA